MAIKQDPQALQFVAAELKEDPEIVYWAYQQDERAAEQHVPRLHRHLEEKGLYTS